MKNVISSVKKRFRLSINQGAISKRASLLFYLRTLICAVHYDRLAPTQRRSAMRQTRRSPQYMVTYTDDIAHGCCCCC